MSGIQQWIGSIVCFMILMTLLQNLLPSKKYERYLRFFGGMILMLLVLQPFLGGLRLDDQIVYDFETNLFRNQAKDLSREILGMEHERLQQVIEVYEKEAAKDVRQMAQEAEAAVGAVTVVIERDPEHEDYGRVREVEIQLLPGESQEVSVDSQVSIEIAPIRLGEQEEIEYAEPGEAGVRLRRKVEQYYGLESNQVKIQW